jgi:RNA-directed DNA polymerase
MNQKPFTIPKKLVYAVWKRVKASKGGPGIDGITIEQYESNLGNNLYKLWNRMSSGTYLRPPVKQVRIPKDRGVRILGVPTVEDRIAQTVVRLQLEPELESLFLDES